MFASLSSLSLENRQISLGQWRALKVSFVWAKPFLQWAHQRFCRLGILEMNIEA